MKYVDLPLHSLRPGYYLFYDNGIRGRYVYIFETDVQLESIHILSRISISHRNDKISKTKYKEPMTVARKQFPAGISKNAVIYQLTEDEFLIQLVEFI